MLKRCPSCGTGRIVSRTVGRVRHVAGHVFSAELPARVCTGCGNAYFDDVVVSQFDTLVAARLAGAGVTHPEALKFMRKLTGLQGKEFAELLAVRAETVSRWERGRRPIDRATYAIIRQLICERAAGVTTTTDYLRSLRKPRRLPKTVRLELACAT
jgi:putative zinc finger/helix-turn-helix YgiT family protein